MRKFAFAALTLVLIAGCTLSADQQRAFDKGCSALRTVYAVYSASAHSTNPKADAAYAIADRACTNPPVDLVTATTQVALAIYEISRLKH